MHLAAMSADGDASRLSRLRGAPWIGRWLPGTAAAPWAFPLQPDEIGHQLHLQAEKFSPGLDHVVELAG